MKLIFLLIAFKSMAFASTKKLNCLGDLQDGYTANICENAVNPTTGLEMNCLEMFDRVCSTVPDPLFVKTINCLADFEDGYAAGVCEKVDVKKQQNLVKRLKNF